MSPPQGDRPEQGARRRIDAALSTSGFIVQHRSETNLAAGRGVAVREFPLAAGHGFADYLLFVDEQAVGVVEAKPSGHTLSGVEVQAERYSTGLPSALTAPHRPLPFLYLSNGEEITFTNLLDPRPRSRRVFAPHRPETLAEWLAADTLDEWVKTTGAHTAAEATRPSTLRSRLSALPPLERGDLFPNQFEAIERLEHSLAEDRPRSLVQMATGSGKTILAVASIYRLIKFGGARRVLFLVDRKNLGIQAEKEFQGFRTPDDHRLFPELYNVHRLTSNVISKSASVVITTIQRLFSTLKGEPDLPEGLEDESAFLHGAAAKTPIPVAYNSAIPPETFDVVFVDECHRSIYTQWRQVLEYFDAFVIGLTATTAKHTFGFFNGNLVMEYPHARAVADGVNVDFEVCRIRTRITEQGSTIAKSEEPIVGVRDRRTRRVRWEAPDDDVAYTGADLDRSVVATDQIRTLIRAFKDQVVPAAFPGRRELPKTLIFAKDDSHAEDIVGIVREEFGQGNEFCRKITYKSTGDTSDNLIREFRQRVNPRVAVTVDLVATGTDIKPIEIVMFMRSVQSRVLFEQMKGRGVRVIDATDLRAVSPSADTKTHFLIVDCVGVTESALCETQPLEREPTVSFKALLDHVAFGGTDPDHLSSLASRLSRLDKQCGPDERERIEAASGGVKVAHIAAAIVDALDPDVQAQHARKELGVAADAEPTREQLDQAMAALAKQAVRPLATKPALREVLQEVKRQFEQVIDEVSRDEVTFVGSSDAARAKALVTSFEAFLAEHKDEIDALKFFYSVPHRDRLRFGDVKALAAALKAPPRAWTTEQLWRAYETLEKDRVRGASGKRLLTDVVSLVKFALHRDPRLVPFAETVCERFERWMSDQKSRGRSFTAQQLKWLEMMRDHVATSVEVEESDFDLAPFAEEGGLARAAEVFGKELRDVIRELNEVLAA